MSKHTKHTKGPWQWKYDGDSKAIVTAARDSLNPNKAKYDFILATVEAFSPEETRCNAYLITLAPRMLDAARKMVIAWDADGDKSIGDRIRAITELKRICADAENI